MPDFPPTAGIAAADVWAYATRALTDKAGFSISGTKQTLDALNDIAAADVWAVATRELTGFTGQPRTDLLGEDADFAAATGARIAGIDRLANMPAFEAITESSILMDGTEKTLIEKTDTLQCYLEGDVDLTPMVAGNVVVIKEYMKIKSGGAYVLYATQTFNDVQTVPLVHIITKANKRSIKVTATQTDATYKTIDSAFYRRSQATAT